MSVPELSTAMNEMQPLVRSTAEAVQWNCDLLNAVIGRVNTLEAWTKIAEPQVAAAAEFEASNSEKLKELTGFGDQLKSAFSALEGVASQADLRLRSEIGQVTTLLDNAVGGLKQRVDAMEAVTRAAQAVPSAAAAAGATPPQAAPGLGPHDDQLAELDRRTTGLAVSLEQVRVHVERVRERAAAIGSLVDKQDVCLKDHNNGMRMLDARVTSLADAAGRPPTTSPPPSQSAPQPPPFGADFGASFAQGAQGTAHPNYGSQPTGVETHDIGSAQGDRPRGPWRLYDEKYLLDPKNAYDAKSPATWLEDLRDYLSGRTPELDKLFQWAELRTVEIVHWREYDGAIEIPPSAEAISQQLWALIGGLVKGDPTAKRTFANVPRHNGFEAFRRIAEPVNEDKALVRKDLLSAVVHPKPATSMDNLQAALEVWDTNKRLFTSADGVLPAEDQQRLALIGLLPPDISANVIMEMEKPGFETFSAIKKYALKLVKVLQNQKRHRGALNLVDAFGGVEYEDSQP